MSIYIKDMEIPEDCLECLKIGWQYVFECNLDDIEDDKRLITCPLVEISPHGRLIDADALAVHKFVGAENDISISDGGACYRKGWNDAIEAIMENAETIIGEK